MWQEPIFNRQQSDVDYIKQLYVKILESGYNSLSASEKLFWDSELKRGVLNYSDLNRIESNADYLITELGMYGYTNSFLPVVTNWQMLDFPLLSELDRIRTNIKLLCEIFSISEDIVLGDSYINYSEVNELELNTKLVYDMLVNLLLSFRYCGTFNCGQTLILP